MPLFLVGTRWQSPPGAPSGHSLGCSPGLSLPGPVAADAWLRGWRLSKGEASFPDPERVQVQARLGND